MARAEIYIEDDEEGAVALKFQFLGDKFEPGSGAHQLCNILRKWCDENMRAIAPPVVEGDMGPADEQYAGLAKPAELAGDECGEAGA